MRTTVRKAELTILGTQMGLDAREVALLWDIHRWPEATVVERGQRLGWTAEELTALTASTAAKVQAYEAEMESLRLPECEVREVLKEQRQVPRRKTGHTARRVG